MHRGWNLGYGLWEHCEHIDVQTLTAGHPCGAAPGRAEISGCIAAQAGSPPPYRLSRPKTALCQALVSFSVLGPFLVQGNRD